MNFTMIKNTDGVLAKRMDSNGNKIPCANMSTGKYTTVKVNDLLGFSKIIESIKSDEAIILGTTQINTGHILASSMLEEFRSNNNDAHIVSRTKEYFSFEDESIILFDIDTDNGHNKTCNSYDDILNELYMLDNQFKGAEILIVPSSSSYIYKDGIEVVGGGSYHIYVICKNTKDNLDTYIESLINKSFEVDLGYYKVSKSGSLLKRQIFDGAVFSPERIIFEADIICEEPYTQDKPESFYRQGSYIDCNDIPIIDMDIVNDKINQEILKVKDESNKVKAEYLQKEVTKLVENGCEEKLAKDLVSNMINNNVLYPQHIIRLSDGIEIKVEEIYLTPSKYNLVTCYDPIEVEKGSNKAIIYANEDTNLPIIHSFVHGRVNYKLRIDYNTIYKIINESNVTISETDAFITRVKKLCNLSEISVEERKTLSLLLKDKRIVSANNILQVNNDDIEEIAKQKGYIDFSPSAKILPTIANLKVLMTNNDMKYDYDVILKKLEMSHISVKNNAPNKEEALFSAVETFASVEGINTSITSHIPALANGSNSNPLLDYIKNSHKKYISLKDGTNQIKKLSDTLQTDIVNNDYIEAILKKWMVQCIASWDYERNYTCIGAKEKYESVLVIQGKQGVQKTKFFSALLPQKQQVYIKTGAMLNPNDKDSLIQNTAYGIVELGELDSTFNKSDIGALKAFLSNSEDEYRAPYGKVSSKHKRCTSFCGSVNESGFLRDPTGARRFWVVPVTNIDFEEFERIDKDLFWGQAYELYITGAKWWFDDTDTEIKEEILNQHKAHESYSLAKEVFSTIKDNNEFPLKLNVTEIFNNFTTSNVTKKDKDELSQLLKDNNFQCDSRKKFNIYTNYEELLPQSVNNTFDFLENAS